MFEKLKKLHRKNIYVDAMCVETIIDEVINIDRKLARSEEIIESLKHDENAILFNDLLLLVGHIEDRLEHLDSDSTYTGVKNYISAATYRLNRLKRNIQMILYGTKFE